jgi:hypothetical protein
MNKSFTPKEVEKLQQYLKDFKMAAEDTYEEKTPPPKKDDTFMSDLNDATKPSDDPTIWEGLNGF